MFMIYNHMQVRKVRSTKNYIPNFINYSFGDIPHKNIFKKIEETGQQNIYGQTWIFLT